MSCNWLRATGVSFTNALDFPLAWISLRSMISVSESISASCNSFSTVRASYSGYFTDGTVFDYSPAAGIEFDLQSVIPGWTEGIPYFKEGGYGKLLIPSALAYGTKGTGGIPPNSVLIFDVALLEVLWSGLSETLEIIKRLQTFIALILCFTGRTSEKTDHSGISGSAQRTRNNCRLWKQNTFIDLILWWCNSVFS